MNDNIIDYTEYESYLVSYYGDETKEYNNFLEGNMNVVNGKDNVREKNIPLNLIRKTKKIKKRKTIKKGCCPCSGKR